MQRYRDTGMQRYRVNERHMVTVKQGYMNTRIKGKRNRWIQDTEIKQYWVISIKSSFLQISY